MLKSAPPGMETQCGPIDRTDPDRPTVALPLLANRERYRPCRWNLHDSDELKAHWLNLFRTHFAKLLEAYHKEAADRGVEQAERDERVDQANAQFMADLDRLAENEAEPGASLVILDICLMREKALRAAGIDDAYRLAKQQDTQHALEALPGLLKELDAMPETERRLAVIQGVFAGNIYDLGATKTSEMFTDEKVDFHDIRDKLKPRPWAVDDLDLWLNRLDRVTYRKALLFVDNAGPDVTLGMLPFARSLLQRGTAVILTANTDPSLNDITHDELKRLLRRVACFDPVIRSALSNTRLTLIPSGNKAPLIDLSKVDPRLCFASRHGGVDLVVLEGMGRAIESNFDAELDCDTLKIAMIKEQCIADLMDAEMFDLVFRFEPTGPG
jgi:type II pantothenate kinase